LDLALDIGNTFVKAGIFEEDRLLETFRFEHLQLDDIDDMADQYNLANVIVSSVKGEEIPVREQLKRRFGHYLELTHATALPIKNLYESPQTLGNDRIAAVVGGNTLYPSSNLLVIDAGTAITFDLLTKDGSYLGGNISPGLKLRFESLHRSTRQLPLMQPREGFGLLGKNTNDALVCGVQNGIIFEMNHYIKNLKDQYTRLTTILTGGDSNFFDNKLNYPIFVEPNLILFGLNEILKYNVYAK
jgi:type III pantothenate kinase